MGFGTILKDILADKNMSIKDLSEATGIPLNTLYSITKRDTVNVRQETIEKISQALDISSSDLIKKLEHEINATQMQLRDLQNRLREAEELRKRELALRKQLSECLSRLTHYTFNNNDIDIILATAILLKEPPTAK